MAFQPVPVPLSVPPSRLRVAVPPRILPLARGERPSEGGQEAWLGLRRQQQQQARDGRHQLRLTSVASQGGAEGGDHVSSSAVEGGEAVKKPQQTALRKGLQWGKKLQTRVLTSLIGGAITIYWVFGGKWGFTAGFLLQAVIAMREYHRMCVKAGTIPARRISLVTTLLMFIIATKYPHIHEVVLPLGGTAVMIWLLMMRKAPAKISEVATTILGMFYIGYLPSFWIRLRALGDVFPSTFASYLAARWPSWLPRSIIASPSAWTEGAIVIFWTYLTIVCADVGAYFSGKAFGKHKLSTISLAAGATSPNKTVEGTLGGFASAMAVATLAAYLINWPGWFVTGPAYGLMLAVVALVGDLTASMFKRDAGLKDSGGLLPGHGGILDRVDSYIFTAPCAYLFVLLVLPAARQYLGCWPMGEGAWCAPR